MTVPGSATHGPEVLRGSAPVTIASGKSRVVRNRKVKNQRLAAAGYVWIFGALPTPADQGTLRPAPGCW